MKEDPIVAEIRRYRMEHAKNHACRRDAIAKQN